MSKPTKVIYDIHVAEGDEGRRLAPMQAQAILDMLTWNAEQRRRAAVSLVVEDGRSAGSTWSKTRES